MHKFPCKSCTSRFVGCHSVCKSYKDEKKRWETEKQNIEIIKSRNREVSSFRSEGVRKALRGH